MIILAITVAILTMMTLRFVGISCSDQLPPFEGVLSRRHMRIWIIG